MPSRFSCRNQFFSSSVRNNKCCSQCCTHSKVHWIYFLLLVLLHSNIFHKQLMRMFHLIGWNFQKHAFKHSCRNIPQLHYLAVNAKNAADALNLCLQYDFLSFGARTICNFVICIQIVLRFSSVCKLEIGFGTLRVSSNMSGCFEENGKDWRFLLNWFMST